jgi:hypothetical protein
VGRNRMSANRRPTIGHTSCLRVSVTETGQITNRDKLNSIRDPDDLTEAERKEMIEYYEQQFLLE